MYSWYNIYGHGQMLICICTSGIMILEPNLTIIYHAPFNHNILHILTIYGHFVWQCIYSWTHEKVCPYICKKIVYLALIILSVLECHNYARSQLVHMGAEELSMYNFPMQENLIQCKAYNRFDLWHCVFEAWCVHENNAWIWFVLSAVMSSAIKLSILWMCKLR